MQDIFDIWTCM
uniref:Uncharacterized protein n=1 Tax=Lepeophtheirus salmonis TaxID=72036 RepID=A0A0K2VA49_LEPSM